MNNNNNKSHKMRWLDAMWNNFLMHVYWHGAAIFFSTAFVCFAICGYVRHWNNALVYEKRTVQNWYIIVWRLQVIVRNTGVEMQEAKIHRAQKKKNTQFTAKAATL